MLTFLKLAGKTAPLLALCLFLAGCGQNSSTTTTPVSTAAPATATELTILSGSENEALEPIIQEYATSKGATITVKYAGSVDIMRALKEGTLDADAVWPASTFWLEMGDTRKQLSLRKSVYRTPVVVAVKKSVAAKLGWVGTPVTVEKFLQAAEAGKLRFIMTSVTQSNSGACAYLGFLYAFAGQQNALTQADLKNPAVAGKVKRILGTVNRSSGSSGWLKDLFLKQYGSYDAMVNYECLAIETNQELVKQGKEPLYVVYLTDGLAVADSPLAFARKNDPGKEELFKGLQTYLETPTIQQRILSLGRRTGGLGLSVTGADPKVFNPEWGISATKRLVPIRMPRQDVVAQALNLYQTALRKPSSTVWCLDFSGSMQGQPAEELKSAMRMVLDQKQAATSLLQAAPDDYNIVIPFNHQVITTMGAPGNNPGTLLGLAGRIDGLNPDGGTNIYAPVVKGLEMLSKRKDLSTTLPAIVLLTDGVSNNGNIDEVRGALRSTHLDGKVAVYSITFGSADSTQLQGLADLTAGKVFDSKQGLVDAFRKVKGYN